MKKTQGKEHRESTDVKRVRERASVCGLVKKEGRWDVPSRTSRKRHPTASVRRRARRSELVSRVKRKHERYVALLLAPVQKLR